MHGWYGCVRVVMSHIYCPIAFCNSQFSGKVAFIIVHTVRLFRWVVVYYHMTAVLNFVIGNGISHLNCSNSFTEAFSEAFWVVDSRKVRSASMFL